MNTELSLSFRIWRFWLRLFTSLSFGWIGLAGAALIANLFADNSLGAFVYFLIGGLFSFVMGLVIGSHVDHERLMGLGHRNLVKRIAAVLILCVGLPWGCDRVGHIGDISEKELATYYREHQRELNQLVQLHQKDPQLGSFRWQGTWGDMTGKMENFVALRAIVERLPRVKNFSSSSNPPSIELTLSENSTAFLDFTRRGLVYQAVPGEEDKLVPVGQNFDHISELDQRVIRSIDGGWSMFHLHLSD